MRHLQPQQYYNFNGGGGNKSAAGDGYPRSRSDVKGKSKIWEEQDAGDDETLAEIGYKEKSQDMGVVVVDKIQHLEEALENEDDLSDNPLIQPPLIDASAMKTVTPNTNVIETTAPTADPTTSALMPMDNLVLLPDHAIQPPRKKQKRSSTSRNLNRPVVLSQIQFNGINLINTLMASARAVHEESFLLAEILLTQAGSLAASQIGPMTKVASYFSEALARRIYPDRQPNPQESPVDDDRLVMHFYEACPYLKFAHFTANQALLEAFDGKKKVHVIDFSMNRGYQWPALLQTLAVRPSGPPSFRLTGIGVQGKANHLQESGAKLGQLADAIHVKFEYRPLVVESLADIEPGMFDLRDDEVVAVNSIFEFHKHLAKPGSVEKLLSAVKDMKPEIVTMVELEANHNGVDFIVRFNESLLYYGTMFDSLESSCNRYAEGGARFPAAVRENKAMSEIYLGKQICNVVACEGEERVERHERLTQWKTRFELAGFQASRLGSYSFRQATMFIELLAGGAGYLVDECDGCLMLGWHTRPLITTSAWKLR